MGAASRKTWLEKQSDEVQFDVVNWDAAGWTAEQIGAALKERHEIEVADRTLSYSLQAMHVDGGMRYARMLTGLFKRNPEVNSATLTKALTLTQAASEEFRRAKLDPTGVIISAQQERKLDIAERRADLEERRVAAIEEQNKIALAKLENEKRAVELKLQQAERAERAKQERVKEALEQKDPAELRRELREIYNLPAEGGGAASRLPG
jgi:hypothetical protein